jgi:hypothetical protein
MLNPGEPCFPGIRWRSTMITNVSSLPRLPLASSRRVEGGAAIDGDRTGAGRETSASTDEKAKAKEAEKAKEAGKTKEAEKVKEAEKAKTDKANTDKNGEKRDASGLSEGEHKQIDELKSRDAEVRTHENAHQSAGGQFAGSPSYTYQTGPDGRRYAIGGEVSIDVSPEKDPQATIAKMESVRRAATAPAEPSPQDYKVAAQAEQMMAEAERELNSAKLEQLQGGDEKSDQGGDDQGGGDQSGGDTGGQGQEAQAQASAAVSAAMQAYQSAAGLARASKARSGISA